MKALFQKIRLIGVVFIVVAVLFGVWYAYHTFTSRTATTQIPQQQVVEETQATGLPIVVVSEDQSQQIQQAFAQSEEDQPQSQPTETVTIGVEDPTIPPQIATAVAGFPLVSVTATPDGATTTTQSQIAKVGDIVHITYSSSDGIVNGHFCKVTQDGRLWIDDWKSIFNLKDASQGVQVLGIFRLPQDYKVDLADIHPNSPIKIQHWGTGSGKGYLYTFASSDPSIFGCVRANLTDHGDQ